MEHEQGLYFPIASTQTQTPEIRVKKHHPDAVIPERATDGSGGYDLVAVEDCIMGETTIHIKIGIAFEIPQGYVGIIKERSSFSKISEIKAGVIDSDYRGPIIVAMKLQSNIDQEKIKSNDRFQVFKDERLPPVVTYFIKKGDKVAQLLIVPVLTPKMVDVGNGELSNTQRGDKGFGSTGVSIKKD